MAFVYDVMGSWLADAAATQARAAVARRRRVFSQRTISDRAPMSCDPARYLQAHEHQAEGPASYLPSIERTYGQPIEHWKRIIRASELTRHGQLVAMLKSEHGLGQGHANALVADTLAER